MQKMITIRSGEHNLSGALHLPEYRKEAIPLLIFIHGFVGSKVGEHRLFVKAARYFTERGYGVFRFDFSGCGESDGDYAGVTVTNQLKEVQDVVAYLCSIRGIDQRRITMVGHSMGGAIASLTAASDTRIKQLILWSPVGTPYEDITGILGPKAVQEIARKGSHDYHGFMISQTFLKDLKKHQPIEAVRSFRGSAHIIHAKEDEQIPKEHAVRYANSLNKRVDTRQVFEQYIDKADHTFSSHSFEDELFDKSLAWLEGSLVEKLVSQT
ncbi:alpha/beta hydrolase [Sporosarcina sp. P12(2017)]|uniref:alpha/beta hydrolase family protein n=1 Tax=unclassified Sporosarcina TaxID=2647733 RepID=UPI000C172FFC|nr:MULTISPECIES: alpha/beta hydrolase [unclassified Sporosarcina]PIC57404.1 alpha/beta hydrolase [Sporosarcina sp. P10]PIC60786.1 alpha/beta hydrolase [Sporosarcina sp. P12(2017)]